MITLSKRHEHVQPILKSLHWLPVAERVNFKVALLVHKCLHNQAPEYLSELIEKYVPTRCLRSMQDNLLVPPRHKLKHTEKAFAISAPKVWNSLSPATRKSESLSKFRRNLKTELFRKAFDH